MSDPETATLENYSIHTVTGLVKRWFRELPDPLLTYRLYKDFLHAVGESVSWALFRMSQRSKKV